MPRRGSRRTPLRGDPGGTHREGVVLALEGGAVLGGGVAVRGGLPPGPLCPLQRPEGPLLLPRRPPRGQPPAHPPGGGGGEGVNAVGGSDATVSLRSECAERGKPQDK